MASTTDSTLSYHRPWNSAPTFDFMSSRERVGRPFACLAAIIAQRRLLVMASDKRQPWVTRDRDLGLKHAKRGHGRQSNFQALLHVPTLLS
jgi:hypothetical protein